MTSRQPPAGIDGVDHINVYSAGRTKLGRSLSNFAHTPFALADHGNFASVEGYWYWLSSRNDRLRSLHGHDAKQVGRQARQQSHIEVPDFDHRILIAISAKLEAHPSIADRLLVSTLPLVHYYEYSGRRIQTAGSQFILDYLDACRAQQKLDVEPSTILGANSESRPIAQAQQFTLF